jgi:phosphoglycerate dehydrogenase-like enzyme
MRGESIIVTNFDLTQHGLERIRNELGPNFVVQRIDQIKSEDLGRVAVLMLEGANEWLSAEKFRQMSGLKLFQSYSAGVEHFDFNIIPEKVVVCGNVGAFAEQMAEHVFASILYFAKNLQYHHQNLQRGKFNQVPKSLFLNGKTIGIVGTGGIGKSVAKLAKCYGMKTIGINSKGKDVLNFDEIHRLDQIDELLKKSDIVVLAIPLHAKTMTLIDARRLNLMKNDCILVNFARAHLVDERALFEHLKAHPNFRAAFDVWWNVHWTSYWKKGGDRFAPDYPFLELPNFLGSPHISAQVPEDIYLTENAALDNIVRFFRNEPVTGLVDRNDYLSMKH